MEPQAPFEDYARPRPLRTYSHKARTSSPTVLPLLRTTELPASLARKHQRNAEPQDRYSRDYGVIPEEETIAYQTEYDLEDAHELEFEPQYASDTSQSPDDYATEEEASLEYSTDEDEDERTTPEESKSTPPSSAKSSSSTKYLPKSVTDQSNRLRRRPFLLFDKLPPRGFKRLKPKVEDSATPTLSAKYKLGDGFSKDEAKPNGLVQLGLRPTAKRRAPHVESKVGALDLTQSSFTRFPKKDSTVDQKKKAMTKKRAYDNSFLPDPKQAERQRKRHKLLKKKDNPLEDKEMLPPIAAVKPKMMLTSAILGEYAHLAERSQHTAAVVASGKQQNQTQNEGESTLKEEADLPPDDNEKGNIDTEELVAREPSVELGESPAREVPAHSASNHQEGYQHQKATTEGQEEDPVKVFNEEAVGGPVQEPAVKEFAEESLQQPVEESPKEVLEQPLETPLEEPVKKPVQAQEQRINQIQTEEAHPKPVTIKESASAEAKSKSSSESSNRGTEKHPIHTTTNMPKLTSHDNPGEQHHRQSQSQRSSHREDQGAPPSEETSPGSGWETYISETDIHTPTPPRPMNPRAKSAVPSVPSHGPGNPGLRGSSSAV